METNEKNKKRKRLALLLLLLLLLAFMVWSFWPKTSMAQTAIDLSVVSEKLTVKASDTESERISQVLGNIILSVNEEHVYFDSSNGVIDVGQLFYIDGGLSVSVTSVIDGGQAVITVVYHEDMASASFEIVVVDDADKEIKTDPVTTPVTKPVVKPTEQPKDEPVEKPIEEPTKNPETPVIEEPTKNPETPVIEEPIKKPEAPAEKPADKPKGNVIEQPAQVAPERKIDVVVAETPKETKPVEAVASPVESVVVKPEDVSTPVNPAPVKTVVPSVNYNKVSIVYENKDRLSLFKDGEGARLVIVFQGGKYINFATKQHIEFTVSENSSTTVTFSFKEFDSSGKLVLEGTGTYTK